MLAIIGWLSLGLIKWVFFQADWRVVTENINLYTFGSYPQQEKWRISLWILFLSGLSLLTLLSPNIYKFRKPLPFLWIITVPLGIYLFSGGFGILTPIPTRYWGGLSLTLILTLCSASIALPLGIILALGRRSDYKLINSICRVYIDVMRAVPLIAVLFFGQLLIPLFLPIDFEVSRFVRAALAFGLFAGAYVAEDIRGGLQAIPLTQYEAAAVLGLTPGQTLQLIIIPQALKTALPALTNQAIGLLQNTSLMAILGLVELLGISRSILANPEFIGKYLEVYIWLAILYWFICTIMALLSRQIEHQLNPLKSFK
ncbi:amino acid ABC transporter permease [Prochlorococcus sp. MIT 1307]|uniref:amino acid ABC transporter permease n=1 Tax=Prochlorococcus sp. MIT 1307 TaxID=3096219 RepID=UPI002A74D3C6|nr:amino acid ABC transporter permease [Prochlorococcus sp. MIT 1307]